MTVRCLEVQLSFCILEVERNCKMQRRKNDCNFLPNLLNYYTNPGLFIIWLFSHETWNYYWLLSHDNNKTSCLNHYNIYFRYVSEYILGMRKEVETNHKLTKTYIHPEK